MSATPAAAGLLDRLVSAKPGEMPALTAAFAYNFLLFTAYYILRPLRDSMGVTGGVENLDDLFGWTLAGMLLAVPVYGWISGRFRRAVFLPWVYVLFVVQLLGFWALFQVRADDAPVARVFFVWVSVFNLFVVSVFWSFMADLFDREQAKRVFAFIAAGASSGGILGSSIPALFAEALGDVNLLLISAALLTATVAPIRYLLRWSKGRATHGERLAERPIGGNPFAGFTRVFTSGYLSGIALFIFLMAAVSTFLYLQQAELLRVHFPESSARTAFLGRVDMLVNVTVVLAQVIAVGRLTRRIGLPIMIVSVPLIVAGGFLLIAASPTLATLVGVYVVRRVGQYAVVRPCREMLYTTVDRESKYKAKNVNDTLVYRTSDFVVAKGHDAFVAAFAASLTWVAWLGAGIAMLWAVVAWLLGRTHERMAAEKPPG
ncbi:MAG: NTP/NDP exchange transporter [Steroidobacteraceae bacterium]